MPRREDIKKVFKGKKSTLKDSDNKKHDTTN